MNSRLESCYQYDKKQSYVYIISVDVVWSGSLSFACEHNTTMIIWKKTKTNENDEWENKTLETVFHHIPKWCRVSSKNKVDNIRRIL